MASKPKPGFYIAVFIVILGLVGFALYRFGGDDAGDGGEKAAAPITADQLKKAAAGDEPAAKPDDSAVEAPDQQGITTVKEYDYVPSAKLPDVKGVSNYKPMADRVVRFAINVWAGWAPIVAANEGFKAGKVWKGAGGKDFKVELVLIDDPVAMRDAFAAGDVHIGWATVDMLPLLLEGLKKDSRVMPRIFQQIDWSNGGDGIVVRGDAIKTIGDLRGKSIVLAQNSPSHFFVLNALINAGVQPAEVTFKFTKDAFQAAAAFNGDKSLSACVSWAPDIYNLAKVKGNKLIVSTETANKLIADVWFARADFAKDNKDLIEGLVRGIFDAMETIQGDEGKQKVARWMADGYSMPPDEALGMLGDAHSTNFAENREFFLNQNNPTNFERTYATAHYLYRRIGAVSSKVGFDQIMDFSVIQKLAKEPKYANAKDTYQVRFVARSAESIQAESGEILTKTVVIHFFPNSWEINKKISGLVNGKPTERAYDPNAGFVVEEVGKLAGQYGAARIVIEGHTDASMKGRVPGTAVKRLANNRANSVKEALMNKFNTLDANQVSTQGVGWDRPADANDPMNHAKNRRVEVKVYPLEAVPEK